MTDRVLFIKVIVKKVDESLSDSKALGQTGLFWNLQNGVECEELGDAPKPDIVLPDGSAAYSKALIDEFLNI